MKLIQRAILGLALVAAACCGSRTSRAAETPPHVASFSKPAAGDMQIVFHGTTGPFRVQTRLNNDPASAWADVPSAKVSEIQPGVFMAWVPSPSGPVDLAFYRIVSEGDPSFESKGWTILVRVSAPANGTHFVAGESPEVKVTILDTYAHGITKDQFSSLNLYMYGPEDPTKTTTPVKLLNASADRNLGTHHYINLKTSAGVQVDGDTLTYKLKPVTDELPGSYVVGVRGVLASDEIQQLIKFASVQIGTSTAEKPLITKAKCAVCHEGPISGKIYMHHVDIGRSPVGSWSLDYEPVKSCKLCHNNDGYAAFTDPSTLGTATTNRVADHIVRRVHGVHNGEGLKNFWNTNSVNGLFKDYLGVVFPADARNCTTCHDDDRWKTSPTRLACGSCHDNSWFGPKPAPEGWVAHAGGPSADDTKCSVCHGAEPGGAFPSIAESHAVVPPKINAIDVALTPPANGTHFVAGEKPVVTLVLRDDKGVPIDHTKVTDGNFGTASFMVYGPRARAYPVLTAAAKNVSSKLRASASNNKDGPWDVNGKDFKISINGSAPQVITIKGAAALVTPAEVVSSLNAVITNLNGGAKASVSGVRVAIRTLTQGDAARIEIYNGPVTDAMIWKRPPGTVMEPDITIAAASTAGNDLRALADPLNFADPLVVRTAANITYALDDVAGLSPGTYNIYAYYLPTAGKIVGLDAKVGLGHLSFQVGTATSEKKVATRCTDCHGDTIFHFSSGPIHPAPFDTDYCTACHDYGHTASGDLFKNQGGTSLNGWSGFGAMPIARRVHGVHRAHYLEHSEEIYANATKDTFGEIIFPQDIRNCTKCHAETDNWKKQPSRLACLACHDSDEAKAHGKLMTFMPNPGDPYGSTSVETCTLCHGAGAEFSPDKVHRISNPYVPPYPREVEAR